MFVRLTKKDGAPIWFNASYIVTVEPMRNGGATVVPIGDGLDYEVRERADDIITLVEAAQRAVPGPWEAPVTPPAPVVVEEPAPAKTPADDAAQKEPPKFEDPNAGAPQMSEAEAANAVAVVSAIKKGTLRRPPAKKTTRKTAKSAAKAAAEEKPAEPPAKEEPNPPAEAAEPADQPIDVFAASGVRRTVDKTPLDLSTDQVDRLRAMAPKTVKKLLNSINAQFPVADPNSTVQSLKDHGIITVDDKGHVKWDALTLEDVLG